MKRTAYYALNAKLRAMNAKLLKAEDYIALINAEDEKKFRDALSSTWYGPDCLYLADEIGLSKAMEKFRQEFYDRIEPHLDMDLKNFVDAWRLRYVIDDLELVMYLIFKNDSIDFVRRHLIVLEDILSPDLDSIKNIEGLKHALRSTHYVKLLDDLPELGEKSDLFYIEKYLEDTYYREIFKAVEKLDEEDKKTVLDVLGTRVDILNITRLYRSMLYYKFMPEELFNITVAGGRVFDFESLKRLSYLGADKLAEELKGTEYSFLVDENGNIKNLRLADRYFMSRLEKMIYGDGIGPLICVLYKVRYEATDITVIMEGRRLGLNPIEIEDSLTRNLIGGMS